MATFSWAVLLGGLAFFFFGLNSVRQGLQHCAGDRLRGLLLRLTDNRFKGFGFGALVTMMLQSSSATTAMLVSFAGAGLLTLPQAFAVVLGSDVGTTAVVFLLAARHVTDYALFGVAVGIGLRLWSPRKWWRYVGEVIFGFGLIFYGIALMVESMSPVRDSQLTGLIFTQLTNAPFWLMIGAALFAALVHSSAATLGLALSLAIAGVIDLQGALPLVLGANIGTTITAAMSAIGGDLNAKRVAGAHVITKFTGAIIAFPLLGFAAEGLTNITSSLTWLHGAFQNELSLQIALAHLLFNIGLAVVFLPFLPFGVSIIKKVLPGTPEAPEVFGPRYLDEGTLGNPSLAFAQVHREVVRQGSTTHELFLHCLDLFDKDCELPQVNQRIDEQDDKIDCLEKAIRFFLAKLTQESLTEEQSRTQIRLLKIAGDFEEIGDSISKEMKNLAHKRHVKASDFSDEGWKELQDFHNRVDYIFTETIACLSTRNHSLAKAVDSKADELTAIEMQSRATHLQRLHEGLKESIETSSIHLDLLRILSRIATKLTHIAKRAVNERW